MNRYLYFIFVLVIISNDSMSQDFSFTWNIKPSLGGNSYIINVTRSNHRKTIRLHNQLKHIEAIKHIDDDDCDSLYSFLNVYDFQNKSSNTIEGPIYREYFDSKFSSDSTWVVINGDTLRKEYVDLKYNFDDSIKRYYIQEQSFATFTDGTDYEGNFVSENISKEYKIYCVRLNDIDFQLNKLILNLVIKYFEKNQYKFLDEMIDSDRPKHIKYFN